eukprot:TRINITY_DN2296_c0_g1_i1.p1 TRINITY_DN2296_c0_g1~~TRINITY_DN2296_c0_g1_i1.p1  ORF type:complete len:271 (-),score=54.50 TRINITY_DN2296_c0_g1_i1:279-1091(-)
MMRTFATPLFRNQIRLPLVIASRSFSTARYEIDDAILEDPDVTKFSRSLKMLGSKHGHHGLTHRKSPEKRVIDIDRKYQDKKGVSVDSALVDESYLPPFVLFNKFKKPELSKVMDTKGEVPKKSAPVLSERAKSFQQSIKRADLDRWVSTFANRKRLPTAFELFHENQLQHVTEEWNHLTKEEKQAFVKASQKSMRKNYKPAFSFFMERYIQEIAKRWKDLSPLEKEVYQTRAHQARKRYEELFHGNAKSMKRHTIERPSFGVRSLYNAY